jgi:hypothetical protein
LAASSIEDVPWLLRQPEQREILQILKRELDESRRLIQSLK